MCEHFILRTTIKLGFWTFLILAYGIAFAQNPSFKTQQLRYKRVRTAYAQKEGEVKRLFTIKDIAYEQGFRLFIRAFKAEGDLELWVKPKQKDPYTLLTNLPFCQHSGVLGPKRFYGDAQTPEGVYELNRFNPTSNFYLSLGIDYPNQADRLQSTHPNLGGDIFIHGSCVTIGCIPLTDEGIQKLYIVALEAKSHGQTKIPVHIFPTRMNPNNPLWQHAQEEFKHCGLFWNNLQPIYAFFEKNHHLPKVQINRTGLYVLATE